MFDTLSTFLSSLSVHDAFASGPRSIPLDPLLPSHSQQPVVLSISLSTYISLCPVLLSVHLSACVSQGARWIGAVHGKTDQAKLRSWGSLSRGRHLVGPWIAIEFQASGLEEAD